MLKKTVTYTNFDGEEVTEDLYFHLTKAEMVEMEMSHEGGMSDALQRIIDAQDGKAIMAEFKNILLTTYGQKSLDGRRFVKTEKLREEFASSEAYSALFMELVTNTDAAIEFVKGIVPQDMVEQATAAMEEAQRPQLTPVPDEPQSEVRKVTPAEIRIMSTNDMLALQKDVAEGKAVIVDDPSAE